METDRNQKWAVFFLKHTEDDLYPNVYGSIYDIADAGWYISYNKYNYIGVTSKKTHVFLANELRDKQMPIAASYKYENGRQLVGHAYVICGVFIMGDSTVKIGYYDPYYHDTYSCTYNEFCDGSFNGRKYEGTCYIQ